MRENTAYREALESHRNATLPVPVPHRSYSAPDSHTVSDQAAAQAQANSCFALVDYLKQIQADRVWGCDIMPRQGPYDTNVAVFNNFASFLSFSADTDLLRRRQVTPSAGFIDPDTNSKAAERH